MIWFFVALLVEREAEEPERVNGDLNHLDPMDIPEMVQTE